MDQRVRWTGAVLSSLMLCLVSGSCAAISGLDAYSQGQCPGDCDGSSDRSMLSRNSGDAALEAHSQSGDDVMGDVDAEPSDEAASDAALAEGGPNDGQVEAPSEGGVDAAAEAGCGSIDTPSNCSACGVACSTATGTPSCNGTTCSYACNSNRQDCNGATAPDTDGCECIGSACCGTGCQTSHTSGVTSPANYYDCNPTGNTTQTQAMAACTESGGANCSPKNTNCGGMFGLGGTPTNGVCGTVASTCYCWIYSGQNAGQVHSGGGGCNLSCTSGSAWN